jgi:hypothetical protein
MRAQPDNAVAHDATRTELIICTVPSKSSDQGGRDHDQQPDTVDIQHHAKASGIDPRRKKRTRRGRNYLPPTATMNCMAIANSLAWLLRQVARVRSDARSTVQGTPVTPR